MATKILLVEDDKSLREIYGVRLQAEGYEIVAANDGEQALAVAIKERPSLIITDVMMPKISGFDMLDILRSTTETKDIKVIMMTALSSDDQRTRGERMGADKYLVKSQVGIEDVVRTVHEVLGDSGASATPAAAAPAATPAPVAASTPSSAATVPAATVPNPDVPVPGQAPPPGAASWQAPAIPPADPAAPTQTSHSSSIPDTPSSKQRVIQPLNDLNGKVDINELLDKELAREAGLDTASRPTVASTEQEKAVVNEQIQAAAQAPPATPAPELTATPPVTMPTPERPAPNVPTRNAPLQAPPRIPTI